MYSNNVSISCLHPSKMYDIESVALRKYIKYPIADESIKKTASIANKIPSMFDIIIIKFLKKLTIFGFNLQFFI